MTLERAIEVFVTAFSAEKGHTHPYIATKLDGVWVMQDGPGRKNPRKIEVVASAQSPERIVDTIRRAGIGWHLLCHVHPMEDDFHAIRAAYKSLGYRSASTEWMFVHKLANVPHFESDPPVRIVRTQAEADSIPQLGTQKIKVHGNGTLFAVHDDSRDFGWVRDVSAGPSAWVQGLFVRADVRGRGYGRALMSAVLQLNQREQRDASVLLASTAGARLYPHLGYEQIAILQSFYPAKR